MSRKTLEGLRRRIVINRYGSLNSRGENSGIPDIFWVEAGSLFCPHSCLLHPAVAHLAHPCLSAIKTPSLTVSPVALLDGIHIDSWYAELFSFRAKKKKWEQMFGMFSHVLPRRDRQCAFRARWSASGTRTELKRALFLDPAAADHAPFYHSPLPFRRHQGPPLS